MSCSGSCSLWRSRHRRSATTSAPRSRGRVDSRSRRCRDSLASQQQREAALRNQIDGVTSRIRSLEAQVGDVSLRLSTLEQDLALHRQRLAKLNELFGLQTDSSTAAQAPVHARGPTPRTSGSSRSTSPGPVDARLPDRGELARRDDRPGRLRDPDRQGGPPDRRSGEEREAGDAGGAAAHRGKLRGRSRGEAARDQRARRPGAGDQGRPPRGQGLARLDAAAQARRALRAQRRGAGAASEIDALQAASARSPRRSAPRRRRTTRARPATPSSAGLIWPVSGPGHEPVRLALGPHAPGDRHRRPDRHADPRRRRRQGDLLRLGGGLRQPRRARQRRRPRDRLRPPVRDRGHLRPGRQRRAR